MDACSLVAIIHEICCGSKGKNSKRGCEFVKNSYLFKHNGKTDQEETPFITGTRLNNTRFSRNYKDKIQ